MRSVIPQHGIRQQGFTILEMLVVLLIIGIVISMATLSVGGNEARGLRDEAERLATLLELAEQESILNGREMALQVDEQGYRFLVPDDNGDKWVALVDSDVFRQRELPPGMRLKAEVEGLTAKENVFGETEAIQILILSSGEVSPFNIELEMERGPHYQLKGDMMGGLTLEGPLES